MISVPSVVKGVSVVPFTDRRYLNVTPKRKAAYSLN